MGRLIYGTAWKKEQTDKLVYCALKEGFRAVSTASQPSNYEEALVALGVRRAIDADVVSRRDVSIQTTFTPAHDQAIKKVVKTNRTGAHHQGWPCPPRASTPSDCPYDPATSLAEQVRSSLATSLKHFTFTPSSPDDVYLDAVILHTPYPNRKHTEEVWTALSAYVPRRVRRLGISNVTDEELQHLIDFCRANPAAAARPTIVQNRFRDSDKDAFNSTVRQMCRENGIEYQAFGVLRTKALLQDQQSVGAVVGLANVSREAALYALVMALQDDMAVLDGTSDPQTMVADINDVRMITGYVDSPEWKRALDSFKGGVQ